MERTSLARQRRLIGLGLLVLFLVSAIWVLSPGLPIWWGPSASAAEIAEGRDLFEHVWTPNDPLAKGDGLGPVFNARSCASCHFQGGLGGGGEVAHNATNYEVSARPNDPEFHTGTIHNFSTDPLLQESLSKVQKLFPIIKGRTIREAHCATTTQIPDFNPVRTESVQTTALFGAGWIDLISDKAIRHNHRKRQLSGVARELKSDFGEIPAGRLQLTENGNVGKFGWKGQFATLEEFVAAACANELGLGTPSRPQAKPLLSTSTQEVAPDLDKKQFRSLVAFVKTLPKPVEVLPDSLSEHASAVRGKELFSTIGCAVCHVPDMGGLDGVYSDFLLYDLEDPIPTGGGGGGYGFTPPPQLQLPPRPESDPKPTEWKTPALWGVADSAPYFHDGASPNLQSAILRHNGDAKSVTAAYKQLPPADQAALIDFLKTLKAPSEAPQLKDPSITRLAKNSKR